MARFEVNPDLDLLVAQRIAAPAVRKAAQDVRDRARRGAPSARAWATAADERVRRTHVDADGQIIPGNLRFAILRPDTGNDINDVRTGRELAREPRDPALSVGNRINCRCVAVTIDGAIARLIQVDGPTITGTAVSAQVEVRFPRIGESERPSEPDSGGGWMAQALMETAAAMH